MCGYPVGTIKGLVKHARRKLVELLPELAQDWAEFRRQPAQLVDGAAHPHCTPSTRLTATSPAKWPNDRLWNRGRGSRRDTRYALAICSIAR
jgi:hypothetical protein